LNHQSRTETKGDQRNPDDEHQRRQCASHTNRQTPGNARDTRDGGNVAAIGTRRDAV